MRTIPLFSERSKPLQALTGGVVPAVFGAVTGLVLGVSATGYWVLNLLALIGGVLAGLEHEDGWKGADRGLAGGALFGTFLLLAHVASGADAKVTLPDIQPVPRRAPAPGDRQAAREGAGGRRASGPDDIATSEARPDHSP
jgi:hypothetical protein